MVRLIDQNIRIPYNADDFIGVFTSDEDFKMSLSSLFEAFQNTLNNQIPTEIGVNFSYSSYTTAILNKIRDGFFTIARTDLKWAQVEQVHEVYDWTLYDTLITALEARGIRPYFILDYNNTIAPYSASTELTGIATEAQLAGFVAFAVAAVNRYKDKGIIWEIWNEPNLDVFWAPTNDVDAYCDLVKTVVPAIRTVDPYAIIVAPAIAFVGGFDTFLTACRTNGIFDIIDAVSLHPYKDDEPEAGDQEYLYSTARTQIALSSQPNLSLVAGEYGYSTAWTNCNTDELQRDWLTRKILYNYRDTDVPIQIIYDIKNDGEDPGEVEHNFGLTNYDLSNKLSYSLIAHILWTLRGYTFVEDVSSEADDYHLRFQNDSGGVKYWSWTTAVAHYATFDGYTEWVYATPILTEIATPVTTTGNQEIDGEKTFVAKIILDAENGAILEGQPETISIPVVLLNDQVVAGASEAFFPCPYNFTLTDIRANLAVAQASGDILTIDVNKGGVSVLTTKLTIDNTEKSSVDAAIPVVIDATKIVFTDNDEITIDIDQIGNGSAYGLWIQLIGYRTPA